MELKSEVVEEILDYKFDHEIGVRPDYSGRAMYGGTCFAIVGSDQDLLEFMVFLAQEDAEAAETLARSVRRDNMGMDMVFYWPGTTCPGLEEREELY